MADKKNKEATCGWSEEQMAQVIRQLEKDLRAERDVLVAEQESLAALQEDRASDFCDIASRQEGIMTEVSLFRNATVQHQRISQLLMDMRSGAFTGACVTCGEVIPSERVLYAYTHECVECKQKIERRTKIAQGELYHAQAAL